MEITPAEIGRDLGSPMPCRRLAPVGPDRAEARAGVGFLPGARHASGRARGERVDRAASPQAPPAEGDVCGPGGVRRRSVLGLRPGGRGPCGRARPEAAEMRAALRAAREEARAARQDRDEAENRARTLGERVRELEARAEMAEVEPADAARDRPSQRRRRDLARREGLRHRDGSDPRRAEGQEVEPDAFDCGWPC